MLAVLPQAVLERVEASEHARMGRRRRRHRSVGVFEPNAAFRQLVKEGRGLTGISVATYVIGA